MPVSSVAIQPLYASAHNKHVQWGNGVENAYSSQLSKSRDSSHLMSDNHTQDWSPDGQTDRSRSTAPSIGSVDEDNPWNGLMILSLDGGDVRGLSSLMILKSILEEIARMEQPQAKSSAHTPLIDSSIYKDSPTPSQYKSPTSNYLPCHYFDYIAGTSTGGLIAIMLGRLRMSVDQAMKEYETLCSDVFEKPSSSLRRFSTKHNSTNRRENLEVYFKHMQPTGSSPEEHVDQFKIGS